ncbi:MAG: hypothetical protein GXO93_03870 [FCB group bacterium]|nr:hypothetical protein [FCB group bacterium]
MADNLINIGIDARGDFFYAARVSYKLGRPEIKALFRTEKTPLNQHQLLEGGNIIFALPDNKVAIKKIMIKPKTDDFPQRVLFELEQSLLEDEKNYCFDILKNDKEKYVLGLITRRKEIEDSQTKLLGKQSNFSLDFMCQLRSIALAKGFLQFCRLNDNNLICLADFNQQLASIAFIYQNNIVDVTYMLLNKYELNNPDQIKQLAIELKTVINFKLASFYDQGITIPLSSLYITGDKSEIAMINIFKRYFKVNIQVPAINSSFLSDTFHPEKIVWEKYLIALGATVN